MRLFRHPRWQHLDYRVKVATTQENKPPTQGTRQWTFTTPRWRCGSILLPSLNAGVPEPTGGRTHWRSASPDSRYGKLAWRVKDYVSIWKKRSSWSLALASMSSRTLESTPVLSVVAGLETTQSSALSATCGFTKSAVESPDHWLLTPTRSAPGAVGWLAPSMADLWVKWM